MSVQVDLGRYHQQAEGKDRVTSSKMVTNWVKTNEDIANNVQEVRGHSAFKQWIDDVCVQVISRVNIVLDTIDEEAKNLKTVSAEVRSLPDADEELKVTLSNIWCRLIF